MKTNRLLQVTGRIARKNREMVSGVVKSLTMAMIGMLCLGAANSADAVTWTAGEIVQAIQQAQASGQPFERLLAQKVQEELAKADIQIIDSRLVYSTTTQGTYRNLDQRCTVEDECKKFEEYLRGENSPFALSLGQCQLAIPAGSLIASRSTDASVSAKFSNSGTFIDLKTNPNQVILTLGVDAEMRASTRFGLEWCGQVAWPVSCQQWARNPACPPPVLVCETCWNGPFPYPCCSWQDVPCPLPDICLIPGAPNIVQESWNDWAPAELFGRLVARMSLTLNHSLTVMDNTITVGANAILEGKATNVPTVVLGPVDPDTRLIDIPVPPFSIPHVDTASLFQALGMKVDEIMLLAKATGYDDYKIDKEVFQPLVKQQQARLDAIVAASFPLRLQLPTIQDFENLDPATQALVKLVLDYLRDNLDVVGEFVLDVVKRNWVEILYYVLTDNRPALAQLFTYQALCPSLEQLKTTMPVRPLFSAATGVCAPIDPKVAGIGPHYADAGCQREISFQAEDFLRFCREALTPKPNPLMGNAAAWPSLGLETDPLSTAAYPSTKWSLSSAAQLAVGVESIRQNNVPYMKRVNYRQVGNCALEMRIYKKDIDATNVTPLLWIHGGSWALRGSGFLGLESLVSSYTEDNFVVFAPFYRLVGDKDGNQECRNAGWQDLMSDVEAVLDWVKANAGAFGAGDTAKIAVLGQSAGGHLAGWLMTHRPNDISRGMLVYPPNDVRDLLSRMQGVGLPFPPLSDGANTPYNPSSAQDILETLFQLPKGGALTVNLNSPPLFVTENSYPEKVREQVRLDEANFPPAFILHGTRDALLTYSQSQVLCEGYGGVVNLDWAATTDLRAIFPCGNRSQLHLFKEADHALEVCPSPLLPSSCRAGSAASAALVADSLQKGRRWLNSQLQNGVPVTGLASAEAAELRFTFEVPAGASNLTFQMSGGSGDADLYVRYGTAPTISDYDCRPYIDGNAETCSMPATAGTWHVMIQGYTAFANVSVVATYTLGNQLQNGVPVTGLASAEAAELRFTFEVPAGASNLTFQMSGGSGDADLYVRYGTAPTISDYDCRPYIDGNAETCSMPATAGTWHVMIQGYTAFSGVTLVGIYQ